MPLTTTENAPSERTPLANARGYAPLARALATTNRVAIALPRAAGVPLNFDTLERMKTDLSVTVVAPDDLLAAAGETYATVRRSIEVPYPPFIGLQVGLKSDLASTDPRVSRFQELCSLVANPTAIFEVRGVCYFEKSRWGSDQTVLTAKEAYEPTLEGWNAYIQLLCEFYGFEKD